MDAGIKLLLLGFLLSTLKNMVESTVVRGKGRWGSIKFTLGGEPLPIKDRERGLLMTLDEKDLKKAVGEDIIVDKVFDYKNVEVTIPGDIVVGHEDSTGDYDDYYDGLKKVVTVTNGERLDYKGDEKKENEHK